MYSFVRRNLNVDMERTRSLSESKPGAEKYTAHKCKQWMQPCQWFSLIYTPVFVHPENLLEVKTYILRRLPVLVYNPQTSKNVEGHHRDPTITSLYFDNPKFLLYTKKVEKAPHASSLRLRWYGHLIDKPELWLEKKTLGEDDENEEIRFSIKDKYIMPFMRDEYRMEKTVKKVRDRKGPEAEEVKELEKNIEDIQSFIGENNLQPILRANYTRTAFQIPGDDRVRVSIDTNLALIREDSLDTDRPCRDPGEWHRTDIDGPAYEYPFTNVRKAEISRFPYAILEIKLKNGAKKKVTEWLSDLMSSHLVKEAPRFSKFVHGVAQLFEDHINTFPFWLSFLETDIRKDPAVAFQEEQDKKAKQAADELAVGSFMGSKSASTFKPATASPSGKLRDIPLFGNHSNGADISDSSAHVPHEEAHVAEEDDSDDDGLQGNRDRIAPLSSLRSLFPSLSTTKYARAHRQDEVQLPAGVRDPGRWIKDSGPIRVEPKVWLANQRYDAPDHNEIPPTD